MPFFSSILTSIAGGFATTAFGSFLISTIANVATSALVGAILGQKQRKPERNIGIKGQLEAGGDLHPRFPMGKCRVDGQLIYHNTWGESQGAPNGWQTEVIKLSDLPGPQVLDFYVNGAKVTVDWETTRTIAYNEEGDTVEIGSPVPEFASEKYGDNLWIKVYDGSQTTADEFLQFKVQSTDRPYGANRIGTGIVYAVVTHRRDPEIFSGFPKYKFAMSGIPLYDPSKDSTVTGGSGSHRWDDWSTWGGDGDDLPAVQVYNLLRGIYYKNTDEWMCGLQTLTVGRIRNQLIPAINKCRAPVAGLDGDEPSYRSGFEMDCSVELRNVLLELEKACAGRISEQGGVYDMSVGAPSDPVGSFDDGMIIGTATEEEEPFKSLQETTNVVIATYPEPEDGWQMKESPPVYSSALEAEDGGRRLPQEVEFPAVPYAAQVQRLTESGLAEARRFRTHTVTLPGEYAHFEPNDVLTWTSAEKGYSNKRVRIDAAADLENGDVTFNLTEVDPDDYVIPTYVVPSTLTPPRKQLSPGQISMTWEGVSISDSTGAPTIYGIKGTWSAAFPDFARVRAQVRTAVDEAIVIANQEAAYEEGQILLTSGLMRSRAYEVRHMAIPADALVPRVWSPWVAVTLPGDETTPRAPTNPVAVGHFQTVDLSWVKVTTNTDDSLIADLAGYNVYRSPTSSVGQAVFVGFTSTNSFIDIGLADNTVYYYWVTAIDFSGNESAKSASTNATTNFISAAQMVEDIRQQIGAGRQIPALTALPPLGDYDQGDYVAVGSKLYVKDNGQWATVVGNLVANEVKAAIGNFGGITVDLLAVTTSLAAINANLGSITAGSINTVFNGVGLQVNIPGKPSSVYIYQDSASIYAAYFENVYTPPSATFAEAGAIKVRSNSGYTIEVDNYGDYLGEQACAFMQNSQDIGSGPRGGAVYLARNMANGSYGVQVLRGGYYDTSGDGYGPFTGSHECIIAKGQNPKPGDILVVKRAVITGVSDSLVEVEISSEPNQKNVFGVFTRFKDSWTSVAALIDREKTWKSLAPLERTKSGRKSRRKREVKFHTDPAQFQDDYDLIAVNGLGEGGVNVCGENGDIEPGDLIVTSSIPGKGMRGEDDAPISCMVAKAVGHATFRQKRRAKLVACVYLCS